MKYFTCEGSFSATYKYHVRLLTHFTNVKPLNLPYYLYRNLGKMAKKVQNKMNDHEASLYHHALIKIIVLHHDEPRYCNKNVATPRATSFTYQPGVRTKLEVKMLYAQVKVKVLLVVTAHLERDPRGSNPYFYRVRRRLFL